MDSRRARRRSGRATVLGWGLPLSWLVDPSRGLPGALPCASAPLDFTPLPCRPQPFILLLAPYAPHVAEELWSRAGHTASLTYEPWPQVDESLLVVDTVNLPVQVRVD